jgi:predicted dehydrogenase
LLQIKDWLNNETIGQIHYVRAHCGEYLPGWHPWEDYKKGYSAKKELGGGVLLTLSHPIDYLSWLFGDVKSVSGIFSPGGALGIDVEECIDAAFNFENGIIGSLHLDYLQRPPEHILKIIGSSGTIVWDYDGDLRINKANIGSWETHTLPEGFSRNDLFLTEMKNFLGVIEGDEPLCSLREGIQVQKIIQAIYQAAETGQVVPV